MKSQRGVTLTSVAIYIIVLIIVIGILGVISASFQNSVKNINEKGSENMEIDKFNMYFLKEVKKKGNKIVSIDSSKIEFATNNTYTFKENGIYLNDNIKIAQDIASCNFSENVVNGKTIIKVNIKTKSNEDKIMEYVLNEEEGTYTYEDELSYTYTNSLEIQNVSNNI